MAYLALIEERPYKAFANTRPTLLIFINRFYNRSSPNRGDIRYLPIGYYRLTYKEPYTRTNRINKY